MGHWRKIDHVAFLMMFPFIFAVILYPSFLISMGEENPAYIPILAFGFILLVLWLTAFAYDIIEDRKMKTENDMGNGAEK